MKSVLGVGLSPAQILFGRELRDFLPFAPGKAGIRKEWRITADERDRALAKKHSVDLERLTSNTKELLPLEIGQLVFCQKMGEDRSCNRKGSRTKAVFSEDGRFQEDLLDQ